MTHLDANAGNAFKPDARWLMYTVLNKAHRILKTQNRRFELERIYLSSDDPWKYRTDEYERSKYQYLLARAVEWRRGRRSALELGCSIGIFSGELVERFNSVLGVDLCREAVAIARRNNHGASNLTFRSGELTRINLGRTFDAMFFSEVLCYLPDTAAPAVLAMIDRHLARDGVIIFSEIRHKQPDGSLKAGNWRGFLGAKYGELFSEAVENVRAPYELTVFGRS